MFKRHGGQRPNIVGGLFGWLWLAAAIVPIYYIVVTSLRSQADYYVENPLSLPSNPTLRAYISVFQNDFATYFINSVLVTLATVAIVLIISFMASYVIVRSRTRFSDRIFSLFLLGIAIPIQATIVPVYYLIVQLGLYDTLWALILPSIAFAIPISVLILTNFLRDVPKELFESMRVDGATDWQMLWRLAAPLSKPALVTVGIYDALNVWNGFLFPLILTQSADKRVLPLSLWNFQGSFSSDTPAILAAVVLSALPLIIAYAVGRRQMVAGLTAGVGK
ncbi:carbohydrate ABC transporter permease [Actinomyces urogenitalis]|uniref:carbohydrate ABC transporter permease n=1 Tax=Actinomyces urogenitalis TaxID=103621 RepID=UPI00189A0712|nr:carbohydrate ABC transporter permease [Actinomyces urogenitalis]MDU0863894.1 carbohydrate ABC transporter permease [Actinomyces urogenitalis]MDU0874522.1 carbohydrate ABC transporter permease [Actinomyces urogenitalis]MDU1564080.1 carbohydrate ABC transporter permease [Actinomyces urogenitalis]MDU1639559.1 carbohydrate ABC transporter permease [Actinomyces urogenitalis]MDU6151479.1 carbohydrate ABC transporter permease [Actinomyces urogenitalis]